MVVRDRQATGIGEQRWHDQSPGFDVAAGKASDVGDGPADDAVTVIDVDRAHDLAVEAVKHALPEKGCDLREEDKLFTRRVHLACDILGLKLVDSLVVAEDPSGLCWTSILARASTWT